MLAMLTFAAVTAHAGIPYDPPTIPIDNRIARVALSAGKPSEITKPHVHLTNRVMIYFQAGSNTIRYPDGKVAPEHFRAGEVQWNNAMGTHTAQITAAGPVDIVHVELKSPPDRTPRVKPAAPDPAHFKRELENNQVRVLRLHLAQGEKTARYEAPFERLLVPLTAMQGKSVQLKPGEVQWLAPGAEVDENARSAPFEAIIVEFKK